MSKTFIFVLGAASYQFLIYRVRGVQEKGQTLCDCRTYSYGYF